MNKIEENKNYITSYAFGVSDALIGKRLASPSRRLLSIFVDMLVVGSLTLMSTTVMAVCIFIVSAIGAYKAKQQNSRDGTNSFAPTVLSISAVLSAIVVGLSLTFNNLNIEEESTRPDDEVTQNDAAVENVSAAVVPSGEANLVENEGDTSLVDWVETTLSDLGLGFGWAALYFSVFIAWFRGQTLGKLIFRIRVVKVDGYEISLWESFGRYGGYSAGLATGLMGFLQVIWDPNRQAIHDKISETVVIDLTRPDRAH